MVDAFDVVIVGGGASGMAAAIDLKRKNSGIKILVLEQLSRIGKKLILTGNGRCNITNADSSLDRFHGQHPDFAKYALEKYDNVSIESFFEELGIVFYYDETGRAYPYSLQASSVVDALRFYAEQSGISVQCEQTVSDILKTDKGYTVKTHSTEYKCCYLIIATGLYSGGGKIGSDGAVFELMRKKGYKSVKTTPAIVQLRTNTDLVRSLKGIKVNSLATLYCGDSKTRSEFGEVLFCDYGLSGPAIMQIAREVERTDAEKTVTLDLMSDYSFNDVFEMLKYRAANLKQRNLDEFFTGLLNKRVGQAIIKLCGMKLSQSVSQLNNNDLKQLANTIKNMRFSVVSTTGFVNSQVTAGGLSTDEFDSETMMSKRDSGLFCIGEILDIDGDCGGFNLHWCWSSAMCAADAIIALLGDRK